MQPQTLGSSVERRAAPAELDLDTRFPGKYLSVTSFKRDGSGVATPVWFVIEDGRLLVKTDAQSFKVKRIRRNATVMIARCSASGRLRGESVPAYAEVLPQSDIDHVDQLLARKYRVDKVLILPLYRAAQRLRGAHAETAGAALAITPTPVTSKPKRFGGFAMKIEYLHASKYGNGATVAVEFKRQMAARGVVVAVHHIRDQKPAELSPADLYVFSSPGRMGKPIGGMRRFLKKLKLPEDTRYAILTTEAAPKPDSKTGRVPSEEELAKRQRVRPIMNEILQGKGLVKVAEDKVLVTGLKGPLEHGWQTKVEAFVTRIPASPGAQRSDASTAAGVV